VCGGGGSGWRILHVSRHERTSRMYETRCEKWMYQSGEIQHLDVMKREDPRAETALFDLESESSKAIIETNK